MINLAARGQVHATPQRTWLLGLPAGNAGSYRLAQLDDYSALPRRRFSWQAPFTMEISTRVSAHDLPGTWGFGVWNDPFSLSLGLGGMARRTPCLPNAAWFFFASPHNHLSFRDDKPAHGFLAQTFSAARIPAVMLWPGALALPLLTIRPLSRGLRAVASRLIDEDSTRLDIDATQWRRYKLRVEKKCTTFWVDNVQVFHSPTSPRGRLGAVIWIDNQFAAWKPNGALAAGTLETPPAWLEVRDPRITQG